ncbi:hypothetical protein N7517_000438 [Penicillium concentricum]|uniref:Uncharacterized protein n=1 Tax=Penicillium concentricum TaxID=293559 RepID=A0A9W9VHX4_9EURO|nr:uncharacterized protein N7517_000438 [Penicillium concentricum]KAJ5382527.1 hypothetical protein N7517_000438 [Penicillium concentricum]
MNGDWEKARSFLSRIKSDFGKFLLAALAYSEGRLSHKDEHMELLVQLQKDYPDPRLEQVKFTRYFEYAEQNGPPKRATDLHSLFVGEKMCGTGVLWREPDDFRKVFEMMAEDMRDACDRAWYGLPALDVQSLTAYRSQARKVHIAEQPPSSESMQAELRDCPGPGPSSSPLPAIPRDPCMLTSRRQVIREYRWDRPGLLSLSFDQQLILFQICLVHKSRYAKLQGNTDFWHRVADQFWEVAGWHWKQVRTFTQTKMRYVTVSDRGSQIVPLLDELRSHIHSIRYPSDGNDVPQSSSWSPVLPSPVASIPGQGTATITFSRAGFHDRISSGGMSQSNLAQLNSRPPVLEGPVGSLPGQAAAKRTFTQTGFDVEISSDDDLPVRYAARPRHTGPARSTVRTHTQPLSTRDSMQDLITKSNEAKERHDFDNAKSPLLLQISDDAVLEPLLEELDVARDIQIQTNKELEEQAKEAELKDDWQTAKSILSRIIGNDGPFLLLALEYSRTRICWKILESEEALEQLKKEYPDPRLEQVELDHNFENAAMTGNPRRIGHHQGLLRAYKRKNGSLWEKPDDFCKIFQMMAADLRRARDKTWYAHPARARNIELQLQSGCQSESDSGTYSRPGLGSETGAQPQSYCLDQPPRLDIAEGLRVLERTRIQAQSQSQPQSQQPDMNQELDFLDKARTEISIGNRKAKALLLQGSSEECKEALAALKKRKNASR